MKKVLLGLLILVSFSATAQISFVTNFGQTIDTAGFMLPYKTAIAGKQATLSGTGLVRMAGSTVSYDNSAYLTANQSITITASGDVSGTSTSSGTAPAITLTLPTVNSTTGSFGNASSSLVITANAKGLITSVASNAIQITESQVTSLVTDLASKQATISLTTTGTGAATFVSNVLNVPIPIVASSIQRNDESTGATTSTITLLHTAIAGTLTFYKNGIKLPIAKWSLTNSTVTLTDTRVSTDIFSSDYNY